MEITTVGLDLAKNVFQVHAINGAGEVVVRKAMRRAQVLRFFEGLDRCLVGIEACGTSHYWAREISKFGHEVRLMPPAYVKPYVNRASSLDCSHAAVPPQSAKHRIPAQAGGAMSPVAAPDRRLSARMSAAPDSLPGVFSPQTSRRRAALEEPGR